MIRRVLFPFPPTLAIFLAAAVVSTGCKTAAPSHADYQMGEKIPAGPITYNVVEKDWKSQLGEGFQLRTPQNRFLLITVSATNGGGSDVSVPLMQLEGGDGKVYSEVENGEGVDNWFGLLRSIPPAQTQQGRLLFDVPLGTYRLKLSDGDTAAGHFVYAQIPLQIDADPAVEAPSFGKPGK
jgi:hypothetical protein